MRTFQFWPDAPYWSFQITRFISQIDAGGTNFEEMYRTCQRIVPGDRDSFFREWQAAAITLEKKADASEAKGNKASARSGLLRASSYHLLSQMVIGADDPRKLATIENVYRTFRRAVPYMTPRPDLVRIPYAGTHLDGFYVPPAMPREKAPVIMSMNGGEMTATEAFFWVGAAASQAGFGFLCFEHPGNAYPWLRDRLSMIPDAERFASPALDYLYARSDVDRDKISVLGLGWFGSCLAPRAAVGDDRIRAAAIACVPLSLAASFEKANPNRSEDYRNFVSKLLGARDQSIQSIMEAAAPFGLDSILPKLKCPFLILQGIDDELIVEPERSAHYAFEKAGSAIKSVKVIDSSNFGGSLHCQQDNLNSVRDSVFDWLADIKMS